MKYFENIYDEDIKEKFIIEVPEKYRKIYKEIEKQELTAEEISKKVKMNISEVNTILTIMELEDYIQSLPGNYFKIKRC